MIISCEEIRSQILNDVKKEVSKLSETPTLAIVTCSYDEPSQIYVKNKVKTACEVGIEATHYNLEPTMFSGTTELVNYVQSLNEEHHAINEGKAGFQPFMSYPSTESETIENAEINERPQQEEVVETLNSRFDPFGDQFN